MLIGTILISLLINPVFVHDDPKADTWIRAAMHASYDLRLQDSQQNTEALKQAYPDHPVGYLLAAERYWWLSQADPGNKQAEKDYYAAQKVSAEVAEKALEQGKYARIELLSYLASSYGSLARFQVTRKRAYFSALRAGMKAVRYANEARQIDPDYYDVYTVLGAFNCFTSNIPAVIRPFGFLIGVHGDKETGLRQLNMAMEKSRYSRTEAKIVYYAVLLEDKRYPEAFQVLEQLAKDFPSNFVFYDWMAEWFQEQRKFAEGAAYFESLAGRQSAKTPVMSRHALLQKATMEHDQGQNTAATQTLSRVHEMPGKDSFIDSEIARVERLLQ
jgi:hypothetical protein